MAFLILAVIAAVVVALVIVCISFWRRALQNQTRRSGYASVGEYLRAAPRSDEEKRYAIDMALKGLVICFVGLLLPPLILFGVFPLFYGARKIAYASMGLGLIDDLLVDDQMVDDKTQPGP